MALEPFFLTLCGVNRLVPKLDECSASAPSAADARTKGRSIKHFIAFTILSLVQAPGNRYRQKLAVLHRVGDLLRAGTMCAGEAYAASQVEFEKAAICL